MVGGAGRAVMQPLRVTAHTVASAAGVVVAALERALRERQGGLRANDFTEAPLATYIGRASGIEDAGP